MKAPAICTTIYAALVMIGGFIGCFIAGSIPSLIAGSVFGILIFFNAYRMFKGNVKGQQLAMIQAITLGAFFVYRYQTTGKVMPALPMIVMSLALAAFLLFSMPKQKKQAQ